MDKKKFSSVLLVAPLAAGVLFLGACSNNSNDSAEKSSEASVSESVESAAADAVTVTDTWVASTDSTSATMSGVYGTIKNSSDKEIELKKIKTVSISGEKSDVKTEFHETITDDSGEEKMKKIDSIKIPANGEVKLEPGKDHIMLSNLKKPISDGTEVDIEMHVKGDPEEKKVEFSATARSAAQEYGADEQSGTDQATASDEASDEAETTQEDDASVPAAGSEASVQAEETGSAESTGSDVVTPEPEPSN